MTAATLKQTAAAEAIEKQAIHMMPSPIAGSTKFHRVAWNSRWKAADNAEPRRRFLMELSDVSSISGRHSTPGFAGDHEMNQILGGILALFDVLDRVRAATERPLRQHRGHE